MGCVSEVTAAKDGKVRYDDGTGDAGEAECFGPSGDDAPPLAGDDVCLEEGDGTGETHAVGFADKTTKKAANGERRIYSRTPGGELAAEFWLKGDGSYVVTNLLAPAGGAFEMKADGTAVIAGASMRGPPRGTIPDDDADRPTTRPATTARRRRRIGALERIWGRSRSRKVP